MQQTGWSAAKIAGEVDVTEGAVRRWILGLREPRSSVFMKMRRNIPGFAAFVDMVESEVA